MKEMTQRAKRRGGLDTSQKPRLANPVQRILDVRRLAEKAGVIRHLKELVNLLTEYPRSGYVVLLFFDPRSDSHPASLRQCSEEARSR
jgi:hypothetical protein